VLLTLLHLLLLACLFHQVALQQATLWLRSVHWQQHKVQLQAVRRRLLLLLVLVACLVLQRWRSCWVKVWLQQQQHQQQLHWTLQRIWLQCCSSCRLLCRMRRQLRGLSMLARCSISLGCCIHGMPATEQHTWSRCR
jgi:hypothetical protein